MEKDNSNFSKLNPESTSSNSPILQRTSDFFDEYRYDSVSAISDSTVADSEFIERKIRQYEKQQGSVEATNNATVYNLRIDKFVIDGEIMSDKLFSKQIYTVIYHVF